MTTQTANDNTYGLLRVTSDIAGALEVLNGLHGVDPERRKSLQTAGYDPDRVQVCVNVLIDFWEG